MPQPHYQRIATVLRERIDQGSPPPNHPLPNIPELMKQYGVSRMTINKAIGLLHTWGLVYTGYADGMKAVLVRSQGRVDRYATDAYRRIHNLEQSVPSAMDAFTANAAKVGREAGKTFSMRIEVAPTRIATLLGVEARDLVVVRELTQLIDGEPWAIETGYYPRDLAAEVGLDTPNDIERGTIRALADAGYVETGHRDEMIYEHASEAVAHDLRVAVGTPVAIRTRVAGTEERITRVMTVVEMAERNRWIWEIGTGVAVGGPR